MNAWSQDVKSLLNPTTDFIATLGTTSFWFNVLVHHAVVEMEDAYHRWLQALKQ